MPTRHREKPRAGRPKGAGSFHSASAKAFGAVVREARLHAGIAQEDLAHMSNVERSYFGRIERGQSQPTLHLIFKVADALGYDVGELMAVVRSRVDLAG